MYAGVLQSEGLNLNAASFLGLFDQDKKFPVNCRMLGSTATSYQPVHGSIPGDAA
jgi:hypothetical protein